MLPSSSDPVLSKIDLRRARRELLRAGEVPGRRRRRRPAHRDGAGHPRGEGGDRRIRAACSPRSGVASADPGAGHARHERPHAARHRHRERDDDARVAARRRHRAELLDGSGAHARADPLPAEHATLPMSCIPNAGLPLNTGTGDAVYPLEPRADGDSARASSSRSSACGSSAAVAARRRSTCPRSSRAVREAERGAKPVNHARARPARQLAPCAPSRCTRIRRRCSSASASTRRARAR